MKNIKKTILFLTVGLVLATPVLGLFTPFVGHAKADDPVAGSPAASDTIDHQVTSYLMLRAIARCINSAAFKDDAYASGFSPNSFEWFAGGKTERDTSTYTGYLDDNGDGKDSCHDSKMIKDMKLAYSIWDLGGNGNDGATALCYSGYVRSDNDTNPDNCAKGTGYFTLPKGGKGAAAKAFIANVLKTYYGQDGGGIPGPSSAMIYWFAYKSLPALCKATQRDNGDTYTSDQIKDPLVKVTGNDGQTQEVWELGDDFHTDTSVTDGTKTNYNDANHDTCGELAKMTVDHAQDYASTVAANPNIDNTNTGTSGSVKLDCGGTDEPSDVISALDWMFCPLVGLVSKLAKGMDAFIATQLCVNETEIFSGATATCSDGNDGSSTAVGFHTAWNTFRILALGMILIAGLLMIISQAMGFEIFDAYTIKKTLPRILIAGIAISLSWSLLEFCVAISNALGIGVRALIYAPFINAGVGNVDVGLNKIGIGGIIGGVGLISYGALGLLSFVATAALAILIAFIVIVIRNILVILLIIMAPIAIACYILPNTEKYFKIWWEWLSKALLMFPLITAFIAVGHVFAAISSARDGVVNNFIALAAYVAPYFLIPLTFRLAGGAIATIGGIANDRSRGGFDRLKKYRGNQMAKMGQKTRNFDRFSERSRVGRGINTALGAATNPTSLLGYRKGLSAGNASVAARRNSNQAIQGATALKENKVWEANRQDDNFLLALANRKLAEQKLSEDREKGTNARQVMASSAVGSEAYLEAERDATSADASMNARQMGLNAAGQMSWFDRENRSTRLASLDALTQTGYQFSAGEKGYNELRSTVGDIVGNDAQAAAQTMDKSQYNLRAGGGRFDLGGINHGNGYDYETGINKGSGYTAGQGKTETYTAGAAHYFGKGAVKSSGKTRSVDEMASHIQRGISDGSVSADKVVEWHSKLLDAEHGATGGNKAEIKKQQDAINLAIGGSSGFSPGMRSDAEIRLQQGIENNNRRGREMMDPEHLQDKN